MLKDYKTKLLNQIFIDFCNGLLTEKEYKDLSLEIEFLIDRLLLEENLDQFTEQVTQEEPKTFDVKVPEELKKIIEKLKNS